MKLITFLIKFTYHFLWIWIYRDLGKTCKTVESCLDCREKNTADSNSSCSTDVAWCRLSKIQGGRPSLVNFCWVYRPHLVVIECFDSHFHSYYRNEIKEQKLHLIQVTFQHYSSLHCKCLQGFTGTLRGNWSVGTSNLWGLHVYPQSL